VDIRTGEIIKDRGVLSELPKRCNFGDLADRDGDLATNTDPGSETADNLAEDEEDDGDEDEDDVGETDAFPSSEDLVTPQITRLAPLRPATSSSDADDLGEFLRAEAIRRELDGGDDSSEDEFNMLPPRSTPARRMMTPARKTSFTARAKSRPLKAPDPGTESEDEFAVIDRDRSDVYSGYRARRTPSPRIPASIPSPPPSSSPGPSTSFSLPSSPLVSNAPLNYNKGLRIERRLSPPTPKRQPLASTSRRALKDSLNEIDLEFPPPQPRAPSVFGKRPSSAFTIDLTLSDDETEDERPHPTTKATTNPKPFASEPRTVKKSGSASISKRPIPFVLIETKRPTPVTSTVVTSESTSVPVVPDQVAPPRKGKPRVKSLKDKPPDFNSPQKSKRGEGTKTKPVKEMSQEWDEGSLSSSTAPKVDESPITREAAKKVGSPLLSAARSDPTPKAGKRPKPKSEGKRSPARPASSDDEHSLGSEPSPTKRVAPPKSSPRPETQAMTPKSYSKSKSTHKSATKPKSTRSTRSTESGATTTTATVKPSTPRERPEAFVSMKGDDRSPPPSPPSASPAPPIRPRIRGILKRKRTVSSGPSSGGEQSGPKDDTKQQNPPSDSSGIQGCTIRTPEVVGVGGDDSSDDPEAGMLYCLGLFCGRLSRWIDYDR
jgi:hypothetical protein